MALYQSCSFPSLSLDYDPPVGVDPDLGDADCSIWVWCPCYPWEHFSHCSFNSQACGDGFEDDSTFCRDVCAGEGGWYLRCGSGCLGPPCFAGRFYGEVSIICRCPTYAEESSGSSINLGMPNSYSAPDWLEPWTYHYGDFDSDEQIPQLIFPAENCVAGARGVWTWCPCLNTNASYPGLQDCVRVTGHPDVVSDRDVLGEYTRSGDFRGEAAFTNGTYWIWFTDCQDPDEPPEEQDPPCCEWWISKTKGDASSNAWYRGSEDDCLCPIGGYAATVAPAGGSLKVQPCCPDDGTSCRENTDGDGIWVFRGGCEELGPPPVAGRFYGETIFVGHCCLESSSVSEIVIGESSIADSCDYPSFPDFWWDLVLQDNPPWNTVVDYDECMISDSCSSWLWCRCGFEPTVPNSCYVPFLDPGEWPDDCPITYSGADDPSGDWEFYGGDAHHGRPCVRGRFHGEIVWYCQCPESSISVSATCGCQPGGVQVTCTEPCTPDVSGMYELAGWANGRLYWRHCQEQYVLCHEIGPGATTAYWRIYADTCGVGSILFESIQCDENFMPIHCNPYHAVGGIGALEVTECELCDCSACDTCMRISVSGLTGGCVVINDTYSATTGGACYYMQTILRFSTCLLSYVSIMCVSGLWFVQVGGYSCGGFDPLWISEPRAGQCLPIGLYTMHIVEEGCDPIGQIPTVEVLGPCP